MVIAYSKNVQDNFSSNDKQGIKKYLAYIRQLMDEKASGINQMNKKTSKTIGQKFVARL